MLDVFLFLFSSWEMFSSLSFSQGHVKEHEGFFSCFRLHQLAVVVEDLGAFGPAQLPRLPGSRPHHLSLHLPHAAEHLPQQLGRGEF